MFAGTVVFPLNVNVCGDCSFPPVKLPTSAAEIRADDDSAQTTVQNNQKKDPGSISQRNVKFVLKTSLGTAYRFKISTDSRLKFPES